MRLARSVIVASLTVAAAGAGLVIAAAPASAAAATRYVATTGSDTENDCLTRATPCQTINYAVGVAAEGDTVSIASGTYAEDVVVPKSLTLVGDAAGRTVITGDGDDSFASVFALGIFAPDDGSLPTVTLRDLELSGNADGFGLGTLAASVRLIDSRVDRNGLGGVVALLGSVNATGSTISRNGDAQEGGAPSDGAGIASQESVVTVAGSTIAGNAGAGIAQGYELGDEDARRAAAAAIPASAAVTRSTISGNGFAGIVSVAGGYTVDTSTVSGNSRGGVVIVGTTSGATVTSSTVVGTTPEVDFPEDGGLVNVSGETTARRASSAFAVRSASLPKRIAASLARTVERAPAGTVRRAGARVTAAASKLVAGQISVTGTVVASQGTGVPDCRGDVTDGKYNASSDAANSCGFSAAKQDLMKTAPKLGPLAANGGPTRTHLPLAGSPLRDKIPGAQAADQRGVARPQGSRSDIGAVEAAVVPVRITTKSLPDGQVGDRFRKALAATGGDGDYAWSLRKGSSLPDGLSLSRSGIISGTPTESGRFSLVVVADGASKRFALVIDASGAAPADDSNDPIAETGAPSASLVAWGAALLLSGFAVMVSAGHVGRRPGRHRT